MTSNLGKFALIGSLFEILEGLHPMGRFDVLLAVLAFVSVGGFRHIPYVIFYDWILWLIYICSLYIHIVLVL